MRKFLAACVVFLFIVTVSSCDKDSLPKGTYALTFEQTAQIDDSDLSVQFVKVLEDSRCPGEGEVLCVWEGQVKVLLKIIESRSFVEMELIYRESMPELAKGEYAGYSFELTKVIPEVNPTDRELEQKDYTIELKIE